MTDIFISYAREDREFVAHLAERLHERRWSVWWDREIVPGHAFPEVIAGELNAARCIIVVWSSVSDRSRWVRDEANVGLERGVLMPVLAESVKPPLGFRSVHAADLSHWDQDRDDPEWRRLVAAIDALLSGRAPPRPKRRLPKWVHRNGPSVSRKQLAVWLGGGLTALVLVASAVYLLLHSVLPGSDSDPPRPDPARDEQVLDSVNGFQDCDRCPPMVVLDRGQFAMGTNWFDREATSDERPRVAVAIGERFAIGQYEVTFDQWQACLDAGACADVSPRDRGWGRGRRPLIFVSRSDAERYLSWLAAETDKPYRLPSEAEWEYACRGGTTTRYPFGDQVSQLFINYGRLFGKTKEVGSHSPNGWGLFDMNGNVWEWVADTWNDNHRGHPEDGHARLEGPDPKDGVVRGGSWDDHARRVRCISRNRKDREAIEDEIGFRVALTCGGSPDRCSRAADGQAPH